MLKNELESLRINTPVLLVTFNRPDTTRKVFDEIKKAKPKKFYFFNDAPREGNKQDEEARKQIIKISEEVDWDCEYHKYFPDQNMGCGPGVSNAITWAFTDEDRLIILEDDCVPSQPFFPFCDHILEKFKDDTRVWSVSGSSYMYPPEAFQKYDYIFSQFGANWGWGTWKRCWAQFDIHMSKLSKFIQEDGFCNVFANKKIARLFLKYYKNYIQITDSLASHAWDIQCGFAVIMNRGLVIIPAKNLISNIGSEGVHFDQATKYHNIPADDKYSVKTEPLFVLANKKFDEWHFYNHTIDIIHRPIVKRILNRLRKTILRFITFKQS